MNTRDKIIELSKKWYEYVGQDHHKDYDCHWIIEVDFAYGDEPTFTAMHNGYIAHDLPASPRGTSYAEAEEDLLELIQKAIKGEKKWVETVLKNQKNYDKIQIKSAKLFQKLFNP